MEDNGGELAERVETRCGQRDSLLRERRETLCPLEADRDQVGSVVPGEVEGKSAANGCTWSLGGMETPGAREVARIPGVSVPVCVVTSVVPVCVVSRCMYTSVFKCVLQRTHSGIARACVRATPCLNETLSVDETPCASGVVASGPESVLPSTPCVKGAPRGDEPTCAPETARVFEARWVSAHRGANYILLCTKLSRAVTLVTRGGALGRVQNLCCQYC